MRHTTPAPPPHRQHTHTHATQLLPPGVDAHATRPLLVPRDLLRLASLSEVLSLRTWHSLLDEREREALRALLPTAKVRPWGVLCG
jgi:hypothetical protein